MKPLCVFCEKRKAETELAYDGAPLGPVCRPCEFRFMKRLRSHVGGEKGRIGWAKFCEERGYNVRASVYEEAVRG